MTATKTADLPKTTADLHAITDKCSDVHDACALHDVAPDRQTAKAVRLARHASQGAEQVRRAAMGALADVDATEADLREQIDALRPLREQANTVYRAATSLATHEE